MLPLLMVGLCVVFRVLPHPPNFAPVGATAVFAGRTMRPFAAIALITFSMLLGDLALSRIHGYPPFSGVTPFVYGGFFVQSFLGSRLRSRRGGALAAAGIGSAGFFILSNLGVWIAGAIYPPTLQGFISCYVAALPFYGATLAGDLIWTVTLGMIYRLAAKRLENRPFWVPLPLREIAVV